MGRRQVRRGYDLVFDLVEDALAGAIRRARSHLIGEGVFNAHSLARWMEVWDTGKRLRAEAETLNLDRGAALMRLFCEIETLHGARGTPSAPSCADGRPVARAHRNQGLTIFDD